MKNSSPGAVPICSAKQPSSPFENSPLMEQAAVRDYLQELGLIGVGEFAIEPLAGGVFSTVLLICSQGRAGKINPSIAKTLGLRPRDRQSPLRYGSHSGR